MSEREFRPLKIAEILAEHGVDYVLIGGLASTIHGAPFPTVDVDVVPRLTTDNLGRLAAALQVLDAHLRDADNPAGVAIPLDARVLKKAIPDFGFLRFVTTYGYVDLIFKPAGTEGFRDLARSASEEDLGSVRVRVASLEDVIRSKQATGRPRDLEQLPTLRRLLEMQKDPND
ncbi:MAG: hypothetical protein ACR2KQ_07760 [Actinomycetota bacterium]